MTSVEQRCSFTARARGDDMAGTAPPNHHFFLVEQPGPWGRIAVEQSRLDRGVGTALATACGATRTRPLLIRRPGRQAEPERRRWFRVDIAEGRRVLRTGLFDADEELLDILPAEAPGTVSAEVVYAVCTHGRHDACCAIRGRPLAAALAERLPEQTWEVSHLGGDRFAGNLVVLPHGLYYGRVDPGNVDAVIAATQRGEVVPELLRGSSEFVIAGQAAQAFARASSGELGIDAHRVRAVEGVAPQTWRVDVDGVGDGPAWQLTVARRTADAAAYITCGATTQGRPPAWELLDLQTA